MWVLAMPHKTHPSPAFMTTEGRDERRFGFPAGYLAHLPPLSCKAKDSQAREYEGALLATWARETALPHADCSVSISGILIRPLIYRGVRENCENRDVPNKILIFYRLSQTRDKK